jgi:phage shock protein PspC (stress-responsive transcriptional regulator)
MKKTLNINLNGIVFSIDEDAYQKLNGYLENIKDNYDSSEAGEILTDIESSIAEKFSEKLNSRKKIITTSDVEMVIKVMGTVEELSGELQAAKDLSESNGSVSSKNRKLYRNPDDVIIAGVCSGLAAYFGVDPVFIRLLFIALAFVHGFGVLAYLVLWVVMPVAASNVQKLAMQGKPVNLKKIEQVVKEKSKMVKQEGKQALSKLGKSKNIFYKILNLPIKILEATFSFCRKMLRAIGPAFSIFFGVIFIIAAVFTILGLVIALFALIFYIDSPYLVSDLPLEQFAQSPLYYLAVISGIIFALVPIIFMFIFGLTMTRRRNSFRASTSGLLIGLWLVAIAGVMVAAGDLAPRINSHLAEIFEQEKVTQNYDYRDFSKLYIGGKLDVMVKPGSSYGITMTGRQSDLDRLSFEMEDGQLQIVQKSRQEKGKLCFLCFDKTIKAEITMPRLESLVVFRNATVEPLDFTDDLYVSLGESGRAKIELKGQNLTCSLSGVSSELELTGTADTLDCQLNGHARLKTIGLSANQLQLKQDIFSRVELSGEGERLRAELKNFSQLNAYGFYFKTIDINSYGHSQARLQPVDKLTATAADYSSIYYGGSPQELILQEIDSAEIEPLNNHGPEVE